MLLVTGEKSVFNTTTRNLHKAIVKVCQNKSHVEFLEIPRVANVFEENPADVRYFWKTVKLHKQESLSVEDQPPALPVPIPYEQNDLRMRAVKMSLWH